MSFIYIYFILFVLSFKNVVGGKSPAVRLLSWSSTDSSPLILSPFPGPLIPFFLMQTVLSRIQTEEMFSSCFLKGVRLLSRSSEQPGSV